MKKCILFTLVLAPFILSAQVTDASEASQDLQQISQISSKTFSVARTPDFVFNGQHGKKNYLSALTPEQENILVNTYNYPLFVSYGTNFLERDILVYHKALKIWKEENEFRFTEIETAVGFNK